MTAVTVFGAGSWGTALAIQLARAGHDVQLWARDAARAKAIDAARCNAAYLPDIRLPEALRVTADLETATEAAELLLLATPTHAFSELVERLTPRLSGRGLAWACKGFDPGSSRFLHEVARERVAPGTPLAVVTGPSFASEVARDLPTAVTVAGDDAPFTAAVAKVLHAGSFRAYTSTDMVGAELGGAVKNVLAIGTGICDGMELGNNARAALITRGLAEMMRLGSALGARPETLMGLAGMGDLVLTCTGAESRNRRLGLALGRGESADDAQRRIGQVVEGVAAALEVRRLAKRHRVKMPISKQVHGILHRGWNPVEGVRRLLARQQKPEHAAG